ncbi:DUF1501 domain-containing protein [Pseudopelagicola sp. nBUS_20]|uniref:DUF1501 domain-containing protein n=1 Tax=Pseudopelagicola sp. nBUS_20 TaxID=3395317 RepID=UPI003EBA2193
MGENINRRLFLKGGMAVGCSAAANPLLTTAAFASMPSSNRLVVIILRGGLDGLDVLRPWGDPDFVSARPTLAAAPAEAQMLSDTHGLHPGLEALLPMWRAGNLAFVQAVSTPYRNKRSHFDGQDILEAGTPGIPPGLGRDGWLNRMLLGFKGGGSGTAYAIGSGPMLLSAGKAHFNSWSPEVDIAISAQSFALLKALYRGDLNLHAALNQAVDLAASDGDAAVFESADKNMMRAIEQDMASDRKNTKRGHVRIAEFAVRQLVGDARVACLSIDGWDTHSQQATALNRPMGNLADTLLTLQEGLSPEIWTQTTVLAMTEFGRTVRENGTRGTDHGTGGTMLLAGGAVNGGRVFGRWPGLSEVDLFDRRDLMPTDDVRRWVAWAIRSSFGLSRSFLEHTVFPDLDLGIDPQVLL